MGPEVQDASAAWCSKHQEQQLLLQIGTCQALLRTLQEPSSSHNMGHMEQASAEAEAATLPSRLRHKQLSGNIHVDTTARNLPGS